MKKMIGISVLLMLALGVGTTNVTAAGAISKEEQRIVAELRQPVTVNGKTFTIPKSFVTQTENFLKRKDLSEKQVAVVVENIQKAIDLLESLKIDMKDIHSVSDLEAALPRDIMEILHGFVTTAADVLGLTVVKWNHGYVEFAERQTDANGQKVPVFTSEEAVKQTGQNTFGPLTALLVLAGVVGGTFVIAKKKRHEEF